MLKILCIGNSFGTDCTRYLYGVARADGKEVKVVNLYIGGCSLYRHYRNMLADAAEYAYEINGFSTGLKVSISQALLMDEWDIVFTQQCSPKSGEPESYEPYATALADYIKECNPGCKFWVHQTWTFEYETPRFKLTSFTEPVSHFAAIKKNYEMMADLTLAEGIIPDGEAMYTLWERKAQYGLEKVHRDGFHADYGVGRYLLALTVWGTLTGRDVRNNTFSDFDVEVSPEQAAAAREVAYEVSQKYIALNKERAAKKD
ncbi:MAG: DUF4886 domain-containing protein [Clostridia bacterium]|nr:DUF4886 domain-containing protein [Clostridia bacterium]